MVTDMFEGTWFPRNDKQDNVRIM